eukprot:TRINITY_DN1086_c0_g1_i1.p1 TRINITY_DN1086_c0_g1~~TRINITY_DN1086_c0_g1_i1.p1  ORF type:complete len:496 (-),score=50.12 TRINITY_DN1086_c0_g1_i1:276-1664(-)
MDPKPDQQEPEQHREENQLTKLPSNPKSIPPPIASITLSLSTIFTSSQLLFTPKPSSPLSPPPSLTLQKIPSQISSLFLSSPTPTFPKHPSHKSKISSLSPLHVPLSSAPRRPADPEIPFGLRRASIVWFRSDLRVHDNETLTTANNESLTVLPVYCFDPRDYGKSSAGFDKTGPFRATFLVESVADLRRNLRSRGSDLVVRIGRPETVIADLAKAVGADAVYAHREVSSDEVRAEEKIEAAMKEEGVEVKYCWGSTLYHLDDLPFKLEEMPLNYGGFRDKVKGLEVRKTIQALDQLRGLPKGDLEVGEIPNLLDLGLSPTSCVGQDGKPAANASLVGGETEALQRLKRFAAECQAQPNKGDKDGSRDSVYGANFSCKISPWLAMGCLSPRFMFDELKKSAHRTISASSTQKGGAASADSGMNWLMFELLWRDFFRFITKKYSSAKKKLNAAPVTACTGALA